MDNEELIIARSYLREALSRFPDDDTRSAEVKIAMEWINNQRNRDEMIEAFSGLSTEDMSKALQAVCSERRREEAGGTKGTKAGN